MEEKLRNLMLLSFADLFFGPVSKMRELCQSVYSPKCVRC